ncbi:hypothetical protein GQ607_015862 [Colletotrichum asianum]|uniref:Uncharacterized protein n=1 Tax=Colletotrichum asianum TaxID=702518 RepID=A0A8H3W063_9PEZI|nr:hypothetical protein GQ607_015862 [Colletotrichum asianum]
MFVANQAIVARSYSRSFEGRHRFSLP